MKDKISQHESSVGWVNTPTPPRQPHSWDSGNSGVYLVMSIRSKNKTELRVAGAKLPNAINGKKTSVWIDSCSAILSLRSESLKNIGRRRRHPGSR